MKTDEQLLEMMEREERVLEEKANLDSKIVKLTSFLFARESIEVGWNEREILLEQLYLMMDYSKTLLKRIYNFKV